MLTGDAFHIKSFMNNLDVRKIPGIGNVNEQFLRGLNINKCQDIINNSVEIKLLFSLNSFEFLIKSALGIARCYHE